MPDVIDSFVIELGLDPVKFNEGQKAALENFKKTQDQAVKFGKEIESQGSKITEFFTRMKNEAIGLLATYIGGHEIKQLISNVTSLDAATARFAATTNMSVREMSAWQGAIEQNGGSAQGATSAISGLSGEMNKFMLTGQTSLLPVLNALGVSLFDQNKNLKTAGQLYLDLSDAIKGLDPARATALLSMIPGMNQDMINLLIQGRAAVEGYLKAAREAGGTTEASAAAALQYQQNLSLLERSASSLGRTLVTIVAPALSTVFNGLAKLLQQWNAAPDSAEGKAITSGTRDKLIKKFGSPRSLMEWLRDKTSFNDEDRARWDKIINDTYGPPGADEAEAAANAAAGRKAVQIAPKAAGSASEQEDYIRKAAIARGIDPNIAVAVAKSEGLNRYIGDQGTSFGPYQLHYKNNIPGLSNGGLGDVFTKQTGLDARDPSTWKAQVDFALDEAKKQGWGPWHGWKGLPNAGLGGAPIGAGGAAAVGSDQRSSIDSSSHSSVQVGGVTINAPNAKNANDIANEIPEALRRVNWASSGNYAQV